MDLVQAEWIEFTDDEELMCVMCATALQPEELSQFKVCGHLICNDCLRRCFLEQNVGYFEPTCVQPNKEKTAILYPSSSSVGLKCPLSSCFQATQSTMSPITASQILNSLKKENDFGKESEMITPHNLSGTSEANEPLEESTVSSSDSEHEHKPECMFARYKKLLPLLKDEVSKEEMSGLLEKFGVLQSVGKNQEEQRLLNCTVCGRMLPGDFLNPTCDRMHLCCLQCLSRGIRIASKCHHSHYVRIPRCPALECNREILLASIFWVKKVHEKLLKFCNEALEEIDQKDSENEQPIKQMQILQLKVVVYGEEDMASAQVVSICSSCQMKQFALVVYEELGAPRKLDHPLNCMGMYIKQERPAKEEIEVESDAETNPTSESVGMETQTTEFQRLNWDQDDREIGYFAADGDTIFLDWTGELGLGLV